MGRERVGFVSNYGIPIIGLESSLSYLSRRPFWVDAVNGNDSNDGQAGPEDALATIQAAVNRAQAGDNIIIFPGSYVENVVVESKDYISLISAMRNGYGRPDIVPSSGKALYVKASQGFRAFGVRFAAPAADTDLVLQEGNGFVYDWCVFDGNSTQGNAKGLVRLKGNGVSDSYTSSEGVIRKSLLRQSGGQAVIFDTGDAPNNGVGCTDVVIEYCDFVDNDQEDIATQDTGGGTYSVKRAKIRYNNFEYKGKTTYIDFTTSNGGAAGDQSGIVYGNYFNVETNPVNTTQIKAVGTAFGFPGNYNVVGIFTGVGLD